MQALQRQPLHHASKAPLDIGFQGMNRPVVSTEGTKQPVSEAPSDLWIEDLFFADLFSDGLPSQKPPTESIHTKLIKTGRNGIQGLLKSLRNAAFVSYFTLESFLVPASQKGHLFSPKAPIGNPEVETQAMGTETFGTHSSKLVALPPKRDLTQRLSPNIRGPEALNVMDVYNHFTDQTQPIRPFEIQQLALTLAPLTPHQNPQEVLDALGRMSQFAQLSDINEMVHPLLQRQKQGFSGLQVDKLPASLSTVLYYLKSKGSFDALQYHFRTLTEPSIHEAGSYLLLDEHLLEALKESPYSLNAIEKDRLNFLLPEGWTTGISPFSQASLQQLETKVKTVLLQAKALQEEKPSLTWVESVSNALNQPLLKALKDIDPSLVGKVQLIQNPKALKHEHQKGFSAFEIADRLKPQQVSPRDLQRILENLSPEPIVQQAALEILIRSGEVYSPRRVGVALTQIHQNMMAYAQAKQIPPENIYFVIPQLYKSYSILAHQYQLLNHVSPKQFIVVDNLKEDDAPLKALLAKDSNAPKLFVLIDDLAGSGSSLKGFVNTNSAAFLKGFPQNHLYVAPVVSTQMAFEDHFNPPTPLWDCPPSRNSGKVHYEPHTYIEGFSSMAYYQSLTREEKRLFDAIFQTNGFRDAMTHIVFPWMGTDTNTLFWSTFMVRPHTLNGKGDAPLKTKDWSPIHPNHIPPKVV
jgi:hypothetical protein